MRPAQSRRRSLLRTRNKRAQTYRSRHQNLLAPQSTGRFKNSSSLECHRVAEPGPPGQSFSKGEKNDATQGYVPNDDCGHAPPAGKEARRQISYANQRDKGVDMNHTQGRSVNRRRLVSVGILLAALLVPTTASARQDELADIRRATAQYHRVDAAIAAGYELGCVNGDGIRIISGCIAHPTSGAMGYHYFNKALIDDLVVDPLTPEGPALRNAA